MAARDGADHHDRRASGRVLILEQLESADPKVRAAPAQRVRRAGARPRAGPRGRVRRRRVAASPRVRTASNAARAADLDAFVRGDRRLPVVLVAPDVARRGARRRRARFADDLVALAHVVVLDGTGRGCRARRGARLRAAVRRRAACGCCGRRGGRRIRPATIRLAGRGGRGTGRARGRASPRSSRTSCSDAATLRVEGDPLVERLARSQDTVDLQERRAELESLRTAVLDDRAAAEELITEYQSELSRADEQVFLLEADLERERELRVRFEQGYLTLATGGGDPAAAAAAVDAADERQPGRGRAAGQGDPARIS